MKLSFFILAFHLHFCAGAQDSSSYFVNKLPLPVASTFKQTVLSKVPSNFYSTHLGFFCRQELQLTKKNLPIHFRLGSMEYCNYMEQKPGYIYDPRHK